MLWAQVLEKWVSCSAPSWNYGFSLAPGPTGDVAVGATCEDDLAPSSIGYVRFNGSGGVVDRGDNLPRWPLGVMGIVPQFSQFYIGPHNDLVAPYTNLCSFPDSPPDCPPAELLMFGQTPVDWPGNFTSSQSDVLGDLFAAAPGGALQRGGTLGTSWSAPAVAGSFVPDQTGGVYLYGPLASTVDFGCGPVSPASPASGYLARIDASSSCVYSRALPAAVSSVITDAAGGALLSLTSTTALDLGCGTLPAAPGGSTLVTRLDAAGSCTFGRSLPAPHLVVALDPAGRPVVHGFVGPVTVDLGSGPLAPLGSQDLVLGELDTSGATLWSRRFGGAGIDFAWNTSVSTSQAGNVYLLTGWSGAVDLGGGAITAAGDDTVVGSWSSTGAYRWGRSYAFGSSPRFAAGIDGCGSLVVVNGNLGCTPEADPFPWFTVARFAP